MRQAESAALPERVAQREDSAGEAGLLHDLAICYAGLNSDKEAVGWLEKELAMRRELKDREGELTALSTLGWSFHKLKDDQSAGQLRPVSDGGTRYRYVVMPMRI